MEPTKVFFTSFDEMKNGLKSEDLHRNILNLSSQEEEEKIFAEDYEGELAVDIYRLGQNIVVKSAIAGVKPENLEIYLHNDLLTIRGSRDFEEELGDLEHYYKECYWGGFSRSIILPAEVEADKVEASMKNGILKIVLPIARKSKFINIKVDGE